MNHFCCYFIPRTNRELQPLQLSAYSGICYFIPRTNRELQLQYLYLQVDPVISYQELIGNYNPKRIDLRSSWVISYQELIGNYNYRRSCSYLEYVISYQELIGKRLDVLYTDKGYEDGDRIIRSPELCGILQ